MKKLILLTSCVSIACQAKAQVSVAPEIGANLSSVTMAHVGGSPNGFGMGSMRSRAGLRIGVTTWSWRLAHIFAVNKKQTKAATWRLARHDVIDVGS